MPKPPAPPSACAAELEINDAASAETAAIPVSGEDHVSTALANAAPVKRPDVIRRRGANGLFLVIATSRHQSPAPKSRPPHDAILLPLKAARLNCRTVALHQAKQLACHIPRGLWQVPK
jgi:hypothetical protein